MTILTAGMVLFFGIYSVPNIAGVRAGLVNVLGEKAYMSGYALLSLGITLMFVGRSRANFELLWVAP
tara:strand:- start:562 stop:762 length:201 start_codon:yes stop_codon:yes gene_type:complete